MKLLALFFSMFMLAIMFRGIEISSAKKNQFVFCASEVNKFCPNISNNIQMLSCMKSNKQKINKDCYNYSRFVAKQVKNKNQSNVIFNLKKQRYIQKVLLKKDEIKEASKLEKAQEKKQSPEEILFIGIFIGLFGLFYTITMMAVFQKMSLSRGLYLIPIYNIYVVLKELELPTSWTFLSLIPGINIFVYYQIVVKFGQRFDKGSIYIFGLLFLPFVFFPVLGFGSSQYIRSFNSHIDSSGVRVFKGKEAILDSDVFSDEEEYSYVSNSEDTLTEGKGQVNYGLNEIEDTSLNSRVGASISLDDETVQSTPLIQDVFSNKKNNSNTIVSSDDLEFDELINTSIEVQTIISDLDEYDAKVLSETKLSSEGLDKIDIELSETTSESILDDIPAPKVDKDFFESLVKEKNINSDQ